MRRNIGKYLDQHINMPPAAVVITAVLRTQVEGSPSTDLGLHDLQPPPPAPAAGPTSSSSSRSSTTTANGEPQPAEHPLNQFLLSCFGWLVKPNTPVERSGSSSSSSSLSTADAAGRAHTNNTADSRSSSSSSPADAYAAVTAVDASSSSSPAATSSSSSVGGAQNASSTGKADGRNVAELVGSALQRLSGSVSLPALRLQHKASQTHVVETLVGVAEVSFRERTRSQAITLNPPQVRADGCGTRVACMHECAHACVWWYYEVRWSDASEGCVATWGRETPCVYCVVGCARLPTQHNTCLSPCPAALLAPRAPRWILASCVQKCGYLCNMAVATEWRRRGVASELMTAIEDMCLLAGAGTPAVVAILLHRGLPGPSLLPAAWALFGTDLNRQLKGLPPVGTCPAQLLSSVLSHKGRAWWALLWAATWACGLFKQRAVLVLLLCRTACRRG